jgi:hypothetical protein
MLLACCEYAINHTNKDASRSDYHYILLLYCRLIRVYGIHSQDPTQHKQKQLVLNAVQENGIFVYIKIQWTFILNYEQQQMN